MDRNLIKEDIQKAFGDSLFKQRRNASETQESLAHKAGLSLRYVQDLEAGKKLPTVLTEIQLCQALNISNDDLMKPVLECYCQLVK